MVVIKFDNVWELYKIKFIVNNKVRWENLSALRGLTFEITKGEVVGIIGENGAGKTTILKLIAGMLKPDRGKVTVAGSVSGLLELGSGFQAELTGRDNVFLSAGLSGLDANKIREKYNEIIDFSEIGRFIDAPVKYYSQGMFVRLAFSVAINMDPNILLIDDSLAVGDVHFQNKCIKKIFELREQGNTIVIVAHDLNMLSQLCKRALFIRGGKIIKDGNMAKVIPLYTHTVGIKEGVGLVEKKPLHAVFNNGRLFLYWKDKLLTPHTGMHTVIFAKNRYCNSLNGEWQVEFESENKLIAVGRFYQLALTQIWKIEIVGDYDITWDIEMELNEQTEIREGFVNVMLTNEYVRWVTVLCDEEFPPIDIKNTTWQVLLSGNQLQKCIGAYAEDGTETEIPYFIFEQLDSSYSQAQVLNSEYISNCRVLQYKTLPMYTYNAAQARSLIFFKGKIKLANSGYIKKMRDDLILLSEKFSISFNNGYGMLYWNNMNITKAAHLGASVYANGKWYSSNLAYWETKKEEDGSRIFEGRWPNLALVQIWRVKINDDASFSIEVNLRIEKEIDIQEQHIWLMCSDEYTYWFSEYGSGLFPDDFHEMEVDVLQKCIPDGVIGVQSFNDKFPAISMKFASDLNNFAKIISTDFYNRARMLRIDRVESENNIRFAKGVYPCFKIEVSLSKDNYEDYGNAPNNILQRGNLKLIFDNGRGRLYWDGGELTKKLGLYTSLRCNRKWHDSLSSAMWNVKEKDVDMIRLIGKWQNLPIIQQWEIMLRDEKCIEFIVKMRVERSIQVDRMQTNIMLSERYEEWVTDSIKNSFPPFKGGIDDDWDVLFSSAHNPGENNKYASVVEKREGSLYLPMIRFAPSYNGPAWDINIVNSDVYYRGRVLQYLNKENKFLPPGEYLYHHGIITIEGKIDCYV